MSLYGSTKFDAPRGEALKGVSRIVDAFQNMSMLRAVKALTNRVQMVATNTPFTLAAGSTTTKIQIATTPVDFVINGIAYVKATTDNITMVSSAPDGSFETQPISTYCRYLVSIDAGGNVYVTKGNHAPNANTAWATSTSYTVGLIRTINGIAYKCIAAHTSSATIKPGVAGWEAYWKYAGVDSTTLYADSVPWLPDCPENQCAIGYFLVTSTVAFTAGTTDTTSVTIAFQALYGMPADL